MGGDLHGKTHRSVILNTYLIPPKPTKVNSFTVRNLLPWLLWRRHNPCRNLRHQSATGDANCGSRLAWCRHNNHPKLLAQSRILPDMDSSPSHTNQPSIPVSSLLHDLSSQRDSGPIKAALYNLVAMGHFREPTKWTSNLCLTQPVNLIPWPKHLTPNSIKRLSPQPCEYGNKWWGWCQWSLMTWTFPSNLDQADMMSSGHHQ